MEAWKIDADLRTLCDSPVVWLGILNRFSKVCNVMMKYTKPIAWKMPKSP